MYSDDETPTTGSKDSAASSSGSKTVVSAKKAKVDEFKYAYSARPTSTRVCSLTPTTHQCPSTNRVYLQISDNVFELSVGSFFQSAFRFRVGYSTESCGMPEDQQGRSFDEYNIVFYRQCPQSLFDGEAPTANSTVVLLN